MKFQEFGKTAKQNVAERHSMTEKQLDEIIPAVAGVAARGVAGAAKSAAGALGRVGQSMGQKAKQAVNTVANQAAKKVLDKASDAAADKMLKIGSQIPIGGQLLKIDNVQGDEVTIADPKKPDAPKTVLKKTSQEVKNLLQQLTSDQPQS